MGAVSRRPHRHEDEGQSRGPSSVGDAPGGDAHTAPPPRRDKRSSRWDDHRAARRKELTLATIVAIRQHGPDVGMSQVAAQARTSKTVVYRHFADKFDLYQAVCERVGTVIVAQVQEAMRSAGPPADILRLGIDAYLSLIEGDPDLYRYVMRPPGSERATGSGDGDFVGDLTSFIGDHVGGIISTELHRQGRDPAAAVTWGHAVVGMVRAVGDHWLTSRADVPRRVITEEVADLAWGGLALTVNSSAASA